MTEHLTIVGSLGRFLANEAQEVGDSPPTFSVGSDIDVLIARQLCERYWGFLEILGHHEIRPVYDLLERPEFPWNSCCPEKAHALYLRVDCCTRQQKNANLDICIEASDLGAIPQSDQWVFDPLDPDDVKAQAISAGHQMLVHKLECDEKYLPNHWRLNSNLGLRFGWQ